MPASGCVTDEATLSAVAPSPPLDAAPVVQSRTSVGRYLLIEEIGRGGMGVVARAYDPRLQREIALKSVRTRELGSEARAEMLREAQAMARLSHPNVVAVYDAHVADGEVVIAMECVRGGTLREWLAQPRSWRDVVDVFVAAGHGLAAAHAAGLLHRDFKPANVLVGDDGRVRVTDFGLARSHGARLSRDATGSESDRESTSFGATEATSIAGTPRYMAPEQHARCRLEPAADQYAFCVALWESLVGQPLFPSLQGEALADAKRQGPPPWPRDSGVPHPIREVVRRGLAPEPGDRWPTMDVLLQRLMHDPRKRRRRFVVVAASLVAVSILPLAAWGAHQQQLAQRCTGAKAQLAEVWDAARRDATREALLATGVSYAGEAWQRVAPQLDDYASSWASLRTEACEATTVRGEQPAPVMDLRMACLHRAKVELRAVTDLLVTADAQVVERTHELLAGLPDLAGCSDVDALQAEVAPPAAAHHDAVEAIRSELAEVRALERTGKHPQMLERVQPLAERARRIPYPPLQAEVMHDLGHALYHGRRYAEAIPVLQFTLRSALSCKQWQKAADSALLLVHTLGWNQDRPLEALAYAETAKGLVPLVEPLARAAVHAYGGAAIETLGRHREAEAEYRAAIALAEHDPAIGTINESVYRGSLSVNLLAQGRLPEAERESRMSLRLAEQVLPADHPEIATQRVALAGTLARQGRHGEAEAEYRRALAAYDTVFGPDHRIVDDTRFYMAKLLSSQGRDAEAEIEYRAVLRYGPRDGDRPKFALCQTSLAVTLGRLGRHAEAETEARAALAIFRDVFGEEHMNTGAGHNNLAAALRGQGRYAEAATEYAAALHAMSSSVGNDHQHTARIRSNLAHCLAMQGQYASAEQEQRAASTVLFAKLGAEHPYTLLARGRLANALRGLLRYREALSEYREVLAVQERLGISGDADLAEIEIGFGRTLLEAGKHAEAVAFYENTWPAWQDDERLPARVRAQLAFGFARALWTSGRGRARARARVLAEAASTLFGASTRAGDRERAELEAWRRKIAVISAG